MGKSSSVIFWTTGADLDRAIPALIGKIVELPNARRSLVTRVKSGTLLHRTERVVEMLYSARVDDLRESIGHVRQASYIAELRLRENLLNQLTFLRRSPSLTARALIDKHYYCTSFGSLSPHAVADAADAAGVGDSIQGLAGADFGERTSYDALWRSMLLRYILTPDHVLEAIEDSILDFGLTNDYYLQDYDWSQVYRPWPNPGYFSDEFDGQVIFVENRFKSLPLPPDLPEPRPANQDPVFRSPAKQLLDNLPARLTKFNARDRAEHANSFRIDSPMREWPDPVQVMNKLERYSLNRHHEAMKWKGFASIGFVGSRQRDLEYLTYTLCSALVRDEFHPYDVKVAADGTGEFVVYVVVPCFHGQFRTVATAWNVQLDRTLALSSAYVSRATDHSCSLPILPPAKVADGSGWGQKFEWAIERALTYGGGIAETGGTGYGRLWVPHSNADAAEFASWYRRTYKVASYQRRGLGGHCTPLIIIAPGGILSQSVAATRMAQYCLGMLGVHTVAEFGD